MAAAAAADDGPLYLGFDLSTQQLKGTTPRFLSTGYKPLISPYPAH